MDVANGVSQARELLSRIGGGATAFPPAEGNWIDEQGKNLWEKTVLVYCFVYADRLVERISDLREFVHRFGRETNQGEVVVEFDGHFWRLKQYDPPGGG